MPSRTKRAPFIRASFRRTISARSLWSSSIRARAVEDEDLGASASRKTSAQLGPQAQVARQAVLVAAADRASRDPAVADERAMLAAQVFQLPHAVALGDLEVPGLDARGVHPHVAVPAAADHAREIDDLDGHSSPVETAPVEEQVKPLRKLAG